MLTQNNKFIVDKGKNVFKLIVSGETVSQSYYSLEQPDNLFDKTYVGLLLYIPFILCLHTTSRTS